MFFDLAFSLKCAGMAFPEIESTLHAEAHHARSPQKRLAQIPSIMNSLRTYSASWTKEREDTGDCGRGSVGLLFAAHHRADTHIAIQTFSGGFRFRMATLVAPWITRPDVSKTRITVHRNHNK